jgi:hypothetical protein
VSDPAIHPNGTFIQELVSLTQQSQSEKLFRQIVDIIFGPITTQTNSNNHYNNIVTSDLINDAVPLPDSPYIQTFVSSPDFLSAPDSCR